MKLIFGFGFTCTLIKHSNMKKIKTLSISILLSIAVLTSFSQDNLAIDKRVALQFDEILKDINKIDLTKPEEVKKVAIPPSAEKVFDPTLPKLVAELEARRKEIENKKQEFVTAKNGKPQQIDKDLLPLLQGMPEPVASLQEAKKVMNVKDEQNRFTVYIEKLKRYQEQLKDQAAKYALSGQDAAQLQKEAEKNAGKAMQDLRSSTLVQEAGGLKKLQQMSQAERAALGKKMAERVRQNPSVYTGSDSDPRKAFSDKMMKDPGYAARFQHMNEQQQHEEYTYFKKENGFIDNETEKPRNDMADRNEALTNIAITKRTTAIFNHRKQLAEVVGSAQKRTDEYFTGVNRKLSDQYASRVQSLPMVDHGEAGKSKETYPVDIAYNTIVYSVEAQNAAANKEVWKRNLEAIKITIAEYNEFLSKYWGRNKQTDRIMAQQNQTPAAILAGACGELISLTEMARNLTNMHSGWQRTYDQTVLHLYESTKN
jgi:hypothetical protein